MGRPRVAHSLACSSIWGGLQVPLSCSQGTWVSDQTVSRHRSPHLTPSPPTNLPFRTLFVIRAPTGLQNSASHFLPGGVHFLPHHFITLSLHCVNYIIFHSNPFCHCLFRCGASLPAHNHSHLCRHHYASFLNCVSSPNLCLFLTLLRDTPGAFCAAPQYAIECTFLRIIRNFHFLQRFFPDLIHYFVLFHHFF